MCSVFGGTLKAGIALAVAVAALAAPAAAHSNRAYHTKAQAENNIAKALIYATIRQPSLGATLDTRVLCVGSGAHVGRRYNHFICSVLGPWKGQKVMKYHAKGGGHYDVSAV